MLPGTEQSSDNLLTCLLFKRRWWPPVSYDSQRLPVSNNENEIKFEILIMRMKLKFRQTGRQAECLKSLRLLWRDVSAISGYFIQYRICILMFTLFSSECQCSVIIQFCTSSVKFAEYSVRFRLLLVAQASNNVWCLKLNVQLPDI